MVGEGVSSAEMTELGLNMLPPAGLPIAPDEAPTTLPLEE